jgi:YD repeat-containing protein
VLTRYLYYAAGRLTGINYPGSSVAYAYDPDGDRTQMTDPTGTTAYAYDAAGRLTRVLVPPGPIQYQYDAAGNRTLLTYPDGKTLAYSYDAAGRLTQLKDWAGRITAYAYDAAGRPAGLTNANGTSSRYAYDGASRLTAITQPGGNLAYAYDAAGNALSRVQGTLADTYAYDALDRLTRVQYGEGDCQQYSYDAVGNRTALTATPFIPPTPCTGTPTTTPYSYDAADQLVNAGAEPFFFDKNGNQVGKGNDLYVYDAENRLVAIHGQPPNPSGVGSSCADLDGDGQDTIIDLSIMAGAFLSQRGQPSFPFQADLDWDGAITIIDLSVEAARFLQPCRGFQASYTYNGDGLRVSKTENGQATSYVRDVVRPRNFPAPTALWWMHSEDAVVLQDSLGGTYERGPGNTVVLQETTGTPSWYARDGLGSTAALTNGAGAVTTSYRYDAYGGVRTVSGAPAVRFAWQGFESDASADMSIGPSTYQPNTGRLTSVSGLESEADVVEYKDGDDITVRKRPGRIKYASLVFKRGQDNPTSHAWPCPPWLILSRPQGSKSSLFSAPRSGGTINKTGDRAFYIDETGVIRVATGPCVSATSAGDPLNQ